MLYILYMASSDDLAEHLHRERAVDRARLSASAREAGRCRGVAWSGFDPDPAAPRGDDRLMAAALAGLAAAQAWREAPQGAFLCAVAAAQKALMDAQATAEMARAGAARSLALERDLCEQALADLGRQTRTLSRSLRAARRALHDQP
jgi:hypothetical protein